ncbi:hypothetical protein FDP41_006977 [Naegleria fowleri]|uniref:AAA+ ATPase domain-containing protein n=1 Tax=Naegleria fowleri TaxID=5763 RepID=A0A6A5BIW9_NAEFO|nr:uncharacterized protein FDP41_006977 [Naegleria fowleri]KAF0973994.1 hypothetical protein FDP41_006977 [Naegleria fowleri]CAG4710568.1 unnamed protein product [Naegleria fowleri]
MSQQLWTEKYRPKTVDDVVHQEEVVNALKHSLQEGNLPHLLFYGPPGNGKTSTATAIAKQLFGPELYKSRVLELNASDERGINVIRTKVKQFAQTAVSENPPSKGKYPCPPFKIIILDEADSMTVDAQSALRRTMETYSSVTRFILICNYVSRIIDPITSRCAKFRFKPLDNTLLKERLQMIADKEGISLQDTAVLDRIVSHSEGDLRKAITTLQSASRMFGFSIAEKHIVEISGTVPQELIVNILKLSKEQDINVIKKEVEKVIKQGYAAYQIINQLASYILSDKCEVKLDDIQKSKILLKIASCDKCLIDGADELLQLLSLVSFMAQTSGVDSDGDVSMY